MKPMKRKTMKALLVMLLLSLNVGVFASYAYRPRKRSYKPLDDDLDAFKHIKKDRDIDRVRQRNMQLTKPELVDLLIRMEKYIAYQNQHWLKCEFEKFINE